jgi:hypothetical protein
MYTEEIVQWATAAEESQNKKSDAAFETIFRISNCFHRNKCRNYTIIFLLHKASLKFKNHCACTVQKVMIYRNLLGLQKYSSGKRFKG